MQKMIQSDIFRAYDIRGKVNEDFFPPDAYAIGLVIGHRLLAENRNKILIGRDGRLSSPEIKQHLVMGLLDSGCNVIDLGLTPTPVAYYAIEKLSVRDAVIVTASHNPGHYNGIKMVINNAPLTEKEIRQIYDSIFAEQYCKAFKTGKLSHYSDILSDYNLAVSADIKLKKSLRIAIDCGNGVTSLLAESLFSKIGCEVFPLFCELDGRFPNHSPDPTQPENLKALQDLVIKENLDIGIAFDGDGDRVIAVDGKGKILWPDRIMMLLAEQVLLAAPGSTIVCDVKCSDLVNHVVEKAGGVIALCPTGHSHLKAKVRETNAVMGGEFSGHIILRDRWSDFDDGLYAAARLVEALSLRTESCKEVFEMLPENHSTPEYRLNMNNPAAAKTLLGRLIKKADFAGAKPCYIDGMRVDYSDGWALMRASNTSPDLTFRFEANSEIRLEAIKVPFRLLLKNAGIKTDLPF
jgi:phosphomannomutase/phosphoglucomutase